MVIRGSSRGNGVQLADYLLNSKENDRTHVLEIRGTGRPDDLKKSLLEMSLTSELSDRAIHGLYHAQLNPAIGEDYAMTPEDWQRAADILEKHLELDGQKRIIVLHEKKGRTHAHVAWERYDHETGIMRKDSKNWGNHDAAREEIEIEFAHKRTYQRSDPDPERDRNKSDYKRELSDLWDKYPDAKAFVQEAEKAGYQIAVTNSNRPWRVITPDGVDENLVRMLDNADTKDVRKQLQPIRKDLKTVADSMEDQRARMGTPVREKEKDRQMEPERPDNSRELSDSQDLAMKMLESRKAAAPAPQTWTYSFSFGQKLEQPASPVQEPAKQREPDNSRELSDSQDLAAAMIEHQKEKQRNELEAQEKAKREAEIDERIKKKMEQQRHHNRKGLDYDR